MVLFMVVHVFSMFFSWIFRTNHGTKDMWKPSWLGAAGGWGSPADFQSFLKENLEEAMVFPMEYEENTQFAMIFSLNSSNWDCGWRFINYWKMWKSNHDFSHFLTIQFSDLRNHLAKWGGVWKIPRSAEMVWREQTTANGCKWVIYGYLWAMVIS